MTATLDDAERADLDTRGYAVLDGLLDGAALAALRAAISAAAGEDACGASGTLHLDDLSDAVTAPVWGAPRLLAAVEHVLGPDPRRERLVVRAPRPGAGGQALHADAGGPPPPEGARVAVAVVALVDVAPDGGATRVVPGTHRWNRVVPADRADRRHPDEVRVPLAAGSALVFNGHLWHSGTPNRSGHRRDALQVTFLRRGSRQNPAADRDNTPGG